VCKGGLGWSGPPDFTFQPMLTSGVYVGCWCLLCSVVLEIKWTCTLNLCTMGCHMVRYH
jgi:hypothetical protein